MRLLSHPPRLFSNFKVVLSSKFLSLRTKIRPVAMTLFNSKSEVGPAGRVILRQGVLSTLTLVLGVVQLRVPHLNYLSLKRYLKEKEPAARSRPVTMHALSASVFPPAGIGPGTPSPRQTQRTLRHQGTPAGSRHPHPRGIIPFPGDQSALRTPPRRPIQADTRCSGQLQLRAPRGTGFEPRAWLEVRPASSPPPPCVQLGAF